MHILNSNLWPESTSKVEAYIVELNAFKKVFDHYIGMEVFKVFTVDDVTEGFFWSIPSYTCRYFDIPNIKPVGFSSKMFNLHEDKTSWSKLALL